jgi:hypothetical protein
MTKVKAVIRDSLMTKTFHLGGEFVRGYKLRLRRFHRLRSYLECSRNACHERLSSERSWKRPIRADELEEFP